MAYNNRKLKIILAAGGTGGHIFPAEALAFELVAAGHEVKMLSDKRYRSHSHTPDSMEIITVNSASLSGGLTAKLHAVNAIALGFIKARRILKKEKPDVVVGFGGYPSFPTMLAAISLRKKTVIHEQNACIGRVNKILAPMVNKIATSFSVVNGIREADNKKVTVTGNPVRPGVNPVRDMPYNGLQEGEGLHLLVTGGSQGAKIFSEIVPKAIELLPENIRTHLRVDQQCRPEDIENVKAFYEKAGINADLATFFEDMPARLAAAHVIICRAGASTIAELTIAGKPAILVPYMYAMDDHQTANAQAMEKYGAACVIKQQNFTPEILARTILELIESPETLKKMAINAFEEGRVDAAKDLMKLVVSSSS